MREYNLGFISDQDLFNHVKETVVQYRFDIDLKKFNENLIDPIKLTFDSTIYGKSIEKIIEDETVCQIDKSNTNRIGYFHQNIFKYMNPEWQVPTKGFDLVNESKKVYVEIKNKHNTMNSSSSQKTYMKMQSKLLKSSENRCYLVEITAKNSQNIPWRVSIDGESHEHEFIRRVSIDKFYELVTSDPLAFKKLCETLPLVIDDIVSGEVQREFSSSVLDELQEISPNILKSLYLLSFGKYEGFGELYI